MRRQRQNLDEVDHELCRLLIAEPRTRLRDLAAHVGVTDETVAARLRRLRESNVLALTLAVDWEAAGYAVGAVVRLRTSTRAAEVVQRRLAATPDVQFACVATGACDLIFAVLGVSLSDLRATILSVISDVGEVGVVAVDLVTGVLDYDVNSMTLPVHSWSPDTLPNPQPPLDEIDHKLIQQFTVSGHESNREIARRLKVSDATVRTRIRRLEDGGLVRLIAGVDPIATGDRRVYATAFVSLDHDAAIAALLKKSAASAAFTTIGRCDVVLHVSGTSAHEVSEFITQDLAKTEGVRSFEIAHLADVVVHRAHLVKFQ